MLLNIYSIANWTLHWFLFNWIPHYFAWKFSPFGKSFSNINCTTIVIDEINSFLDLCNDFILNTEIHVELFGYHLVWVLSIHQKDYSPRQTIIQSCEQEFFFVIPFVSAQLMIHQWIKFEMYYGINARNNFWGCNVWVHYSKKLIVIIKMNYLLDYLLLKFVIRTFSKHLCFVLSN